MNPAVIGTIVIVCLFCVTIAFVTVWLFRPWLQCFLSGAPVPLFEIVAMSFRRSPVKRICEKRIRANNAGIDLFCKKLERALLQGVDIGQAVDAPCLAKRTDQQVRWEDLVETALAEQRITHHESL